MQYFPGDSTVDAAILSDYGYFQIEQGLFTHMRRIKIYTREGLNQLIFNAPVESKSDFRGFVMNEVDGKLVKEKISNDHIFIERSEGFTNIRVAPPNVREGSVVDISFSFRGFPSVWQFQQRIPVLYSELFIPQSTNVSFSFTQIGFELLEVKQVGWYIARDMPAFRPEPYIDSEDNYMTSMMIDLQSVFYSTSSTVYREFASSWDAVNDYYREAPDFAGRLKNPCFYLSDCLDEVRSTCTDTVEMASMALRKLQDHVSWNERSVIYPENLKGAWTDGSGSSAEMNFLYLVMLDKLGIKAYPVLTSQRSRGKINPYRPTLTRFNYIMTMVDLGDRQILVDASDKFAPLGLLPDRCINGGGFLINEDEGEWITYVPAESNKKMNSCNLMVGPSGEVTGSLHINYQDYGALDFRRNFDEYTNTDAYLEAFEKSNQGVLVEEYENNIEEDPYGGVVEKMTVEIDGNVTAIGDMMTINPVFFDRMTENPFKLEKREYPVDFTTPVNRMSIINLVVPEGYTVEQLPESVSVVVQNSSAAYQYRAQQIGRNIQVMINFEIRKPVFIETEYEELKMFFNLMVQKEQENIILKKTV